MDSDFDLTEVVTDILSHLDSKLTEDWTLGTLDELALRLARLREIQGLALRLSQDIEDTLIADMPTDVIEITGVGLLRRIERQSSTWSDGGASERIRDDLAAAVARDVSLDIATGEYDPVKRNIAMATLRAAYEAIPAFSSLKTAGRKRFGLKIGDYRQFTTFYKVAVETGDEQ